ncbi:hypothetical protein VTO42DRAFT_1466 [Malbranchea cinnamomea]
MPPRVDLVSCARPLNGLTSTFAKLSLNNPIAHSVRAVSTKRNKDKKKGRHPFEVAQARARKAANLSRRQALEKERESQLGDPVLGKPTPFTESLMQCHQLGATYESQAGPEAKPIKRLNYFLTSEELEAGLEYSKALTEPVQAKDKEAGSFDPQQAEEAKKRHEEEHENAKEAINRIVKLTNSSGKDRTRVNIQRCIEEFGRHNTDLVLPPKPASFQHPNAPERPPPRPRAGPDTGSSEVQIAILTSKILVLAKQLESTGHKDKHNKRNLRLLVHRRQKLLKYLRRKERGGPRWQNLVEKLGLTDAAWKGEISL